MTRPSNEINGVSEMTGLLAPGDEVRAARRVSPARSMSCWARAGRARSIAAGCKGIDLALKWYYSHTATAGSGRRCSR